MKTAAYLAALAAVAALAGLGVTLPAQPAAEITARIDGRTIVVPLCQEDEILAPVEYGATTRYVCVTLDDFADPASIARLDAIVERR